MGEMSISRKKVSNQTFAVVDSVNVDETSRKMRMENRWMWCSVGMKLETSE